MLKKKIIIFLIALSVFINMPIQTYATETDDATEEITNENISTNEDNNEITDDMDISQPTEPDTVDPDYTLETPTTDESTTDTTIPEDTVTNPTIEETKPSYGWVNVISSVYNCDFKDEFKIHLEFKNKETDEVLTKEFSSTASFNNTIKLPLGTYTITLKETQYEENIIYEKEITIVDKEYEYELEFNNINVEKLPDELETPEDEGEKENTGLYLLKNNFVFLILLIGCGGFLLYNEIKKRR